MATLAEDLLADLMSSGSEESDFEHVENEVMDGYDLDEVVAGTSTADNSGEDGSMNGEHVRQEFSDLAATLGSVKLSSQLSQCLAELLKASEQTLLQKANALSWSLEDEILSINKAVRDHYSVRFPELEQLIQNPMQYVKVVDVVGNGPMETISGVRLREILDGSLVIAVKMEATKTSGREMSSAESEGVKCLVQTALSLDKGKHLLINFVKLRINQLAPNLAVLLGSETAAQLVSGAGGLVALAKVPACNLPAMGSKEVILGMATNTRSRRRGFLYHTSMVQSVAPDHRNRAMRIVSAKCSLAARCDVVRSTPDGSTGIKLKAEIEERMEKLAHKAPNARTRALPAPDDKPARKRGGRRARKAKEQYSITELQKAQNRMAFGKQEVEIGIGDETEGLGLLGQSQDGPVRALAVDNRTRAKLSKKNVGWGATTGNSGLSSSLRGLGQGTGNSISLSGHGLRSSGINGSVGTGQGAGFTSVIAFTPFQGLELVNPKVREELERKRKADDDKWFKSGSFTQLSGNTKPPIPMADRTDDEGFKVPALPVNKKSKSAAAG